MNHRTARWSRREFIKRSTLAVGGTITVGSLLSCGGSEESGTSRFGDPRKGEKFNLELVPTGDEFIAPIFDWYRDEIQKESGIRLAPVNSYPSYGEAQALLPKIIGGKTPPFNLMSYASLFFGDVVASGALEPLDKYLQNFDGYDEYSDGISPAFREFYTKFQGQTYGLMADGDVHVLHYRPSYFENDEYANKFESRFGRELSVPNTWEEYLEVARFFTEELSGEGVYGTQVFGDKSYAWAFFFNIAASNGVRYFTEDMEPQINSPEAVRALEIYREMKELSAPSAENFGGDETIGNWQQGKVVMTPWWQDLREFSARANTEIQGDVNDTVLPAMEGGERKAMLAFSRTFSVPAKQSEEQKAAAAYAIYRLSHPDYSVYSCADPLNGLDPYSNAHFTEDAAKAYVEPNPLRKTSEKYPTNNGTFESIEQARDHLKAIKNSVAVGFPQPTWPGTPEYVEVLGTEVQACLAGAKSPKQALDDAAKQWSELVDRRGRDEQKEFYASFVESARRLNLY